MALWPDQDNELKAPERSKTDDSQTIEPLKSKSEPPEDKKLVTDPLEEDSQSETKKKDVHSLDDGQLKALLDEAIQYKNPKDREGKSKIFRELLQKVEDEIDCNSPIVGIRRKIGRSTYTVREGNRIITVSERASRGGSLQNIFHAASSAEFDTHHTSGTRKKSKRQSPGSSVSSRQREGGSLPSNVNAGWPLESWQSDQTRKKGLFDRDSQQQNHISVGLGNTASGVSSSVASSTQARRQTLMHSASNELPSSRKQNSGELYPLRRHHSSSDQSKSAELATTKLKTQSEGSTVAKKMPQASKPADYISIDMDLSIEMESCGESDTALCFDKKFPININKKIRITPADIEREIANNNNLEVYTSRTSLDVDPMESTIDFDIVSKVNIGVELNEKYPAVQCIVGGSSKLSEGANQQGRTADVRGSRSHKYRNSISVVHISPKSTNEPSRTDENGNALSLTNLSGRGSTLKKNYKRKLTEKNVVLSVSENIAGYRGNEEVDDLVNFIESDDYNKSKNLKKTLMKGKKHEKKRQNIQKSSSLEEISQRNIEDSTESSENQRNGRKTKIGNNEEPEIRERRSWGDQVYVRSERPNNIAAEQTEDNNSDGDFQMVTKKQRKRKVNDPNAKRIRNHRSMKRSPRRKSTSSVPPSERSGDSDLDSILSLPVGGAPITSYADIAAGNSNYFNPKGMGEMSTFNKKESSQRKSASAKNNEIQEWCNSVSQHMENNIKNNNNNNNSNNNTSNINKNNSPNNHNNINNNNDSNYIYDINNINNNANNSISYLKNFSRQDENRKQQNLDVDQNGICDTNVRKLKDLVIVDKSIVDSEVTKSDKVVEPPLKNEFKKVATNCDLNQCKNLDNKNVEVKKNWNKKNFSREDFPTLPVKSDISNYQKSKETTDGSSLPKIKQYSSLSDADKQSDESKCDGIPGKTEKKSTSDEDVQHRRSNRSKSVGPNARPAVILLHDERPQEAGVREITFGFEVNEQLLTSDDSGQLNDEELEPVANASNPMMKSVKIGGVNVGSGTKKNCKGVVVDGTGNDSNGGIVYNDVIENRKALKNSSKSTFGEITNSTVQELFKRHEMASRMAPHHSNANSTNSATSIANKYVPPSSPIDFNHDKIVTFVGTAWEDVMRTGKIQYYSGEK